MPMKVDCSESVEDVLNRLDRESKLKKLQKSQELLKEKENLTTTAITAESSGGLNTGLVRDLRDESDKARKLYPERGGEKFKSSWWAVMFRGEGREGVDKIRCERNVWNVLQESPLVKLMMSALKASGCEVDIRRHISCEVCDVSVTGGYDPFLNQVVVCQNSARSKGMIQGVLTHEMIHMFDYCRHKLDLDNIKHLACTEIRAANLAHCSFLSSLSYGTGSLFSVQKQHRFCVRQRAIDSVLAVRDCSTEEAADAVDSVFEKCYNDLEPVGRRIRRNSDHMEKAYIDRQTMGYV